MCKEYCGVESWWLKYHNSYDISKIRPTEPKNNKLRKISFIVANKNNKISIKDRNLLFATIKHLQEQGVTIEQILEQWNASRQRFEDRVYLVEKEEE